MFSRTIDLLLNPEFLQGVGRVLGVDNAPSVGKGLALGNASPVKAEEDVVEDCGVEGHSVVVILDKGESFPGADVGLCSNFATTRASKASDTTSVEGNVAVGKFNGLNSD